jgi:hypothetical protein
LPGEPIGVAADRNILVTLRPFQIRTLRLRALG